MTPEALRAYFAAEGAATRAALAEGRCPKCGSDQIDMRRDSRQDGPHEGPGDWFIFRCKACEDGFDIVIGIEVPMVNIDINIRLDPEDVVVREPGGFEFIKRDILPPGEQE